MRRPPDRAIDDVQKERDRADVIFMPMRQKSAEHAVFALLEPREIGPHDVHAEVVVREADAAIDDEDAALVLESETVHAHFAEPPERHDSNRAGWTRGSGNRHDEVVIPRPQGRML